MSTISHSMLLYRALKAAMNSSGYIEKEPASLNDVSIDGYFDLEKAAADFLRSVEERPDALP